MLALRPINSFAALLPAEHIQERIDSGKVLVPIWKLKFFHPQQLCITARAKLLRVVAYSVAPSCNVVDRQKIGHTLTDFAKNRQIACDHRYPGGERLHQRDAVTFGKTWKQQRSRSGKNAGKTPVVEWPDL